MRVVEERKEPYVPTSVTLDKEMVEQARAYGINVSHVSRQALSLAIKAARSKRPQTLVLEP